MFVWQRSILKRLYCPVNVRTLRWGIQLTFHRRYLVAASFELVLGVPFALQNGGFLDGG